MECQGLAVALREVPLIWVKLSGGRWCRLLDLDFRMIQTYGVFVIWHGGYPSRVVRVGHGDVGAELQACACDARVLSYLGDGPLFVTWASADASAAAGVHLYLEEKFRPLIADRVAPGATAIAAHAPF